MLEQCVYIGPVVLFTLLRKYCHKKTLKNLIMETLKDADFSWNNDTMLSYTL